MMSPLLGWKAAGEHEHGSRVPALCVAAALTVAVMLVTSMAASKQPGVLHDAVLLVGDSMSNSTGVTAELNDYINTITTAWTAFCAFCSMIFARAPMAERQWYKLKWMCHGTFLQNIWNFCSRSHGTASHKNNFIDKAKRCTGHSLISASTFAALAMEQLASIHSLHALSKADLNAFKTDHGLTTGEIDCVEGLQRKLRLEQSESGSGSGSSVPPTSALVDAWRHRFEVKSADLRRANEDKVALEQRVEQTVMQATVLQTSLDSLALEKQKEEARANQFQDEVNCLQAQAEVQRFQDEQKRADKFQAEVERLEARLEATVAERDQAAQDAETVRQAVEPLEATMAERDRAARDAETARQAEVESLKARLEATVAERDQAAQDAETARQAVESLEATMAERDRAARDAETVRQADVERLEARLKATVAESDQAAQDAEGANFVSIMANPTAEFDTTRGKFTAEIYLDRLPIAASSFIDLCKTGFFEGLHFDLLVKGTFPNSTTAAYGSSTTAVEFHSEGSPPDGTFPNLKTGGIEKRYNGGKIQDECIRLSNVPGTLSMPRFGQPYRCGCQFIVNVDNNSYYDWFQPGVQEHSDRGFQVFGNIVIGYDACLCNISRNVNPSTPIKINKITISGV